ncbi:MAG: hypothetical protein GY795_27465 [Desulfobacterales bacterium]|nr:hypothetical protein [Desulfobacterales bacterium]
MTETEGERNNNMASDQTVPNKTVKKIIKGLLWQDWLKTELTLCVYFEIWLVSSFFLMTFILPHVIIFFWMIYAVFIASSCNIGEKEFYFCLPPKRTWQYLARMLIGLATTLWLSVASLLTMALFLPQFMWRYIGLIFYDPFYLTDTVWYMLALTVIGPVLSFIFAYVFQSALIQNRYAAILSGILAGITGPWIFFMVGVSIEWLIWKNGLSYKDGITTGIVSIPLMVLAGIGLLIHGYFHVRQSDASAGAGIRKKWYLAGGIAVFVIMTCISGIMTWTRSEYQEEKQRMMRYEHQEEKSQPVIVPPKVRRIFKQVCEKGNYPRWQGYGESRNKSSDHESAGIKFLLILFVVAIPLAAWHVMQRWFSDSNLILKKRSISISRLTRVKLLVTATILLGLAVWASMNSVQQQYDRYREPLRQTMLVPTLPSPIPEKPEQGDQFEADQGRFLLQILVIRDLDMHPIYAKTYDIRGPLKERKPIHFELKLGNNKISEHKIKLEQKMWQWSSENMEESDELRFVATGKFDRRNIILTNDVPIFFEYSGQAQTIDSTFSLWYGKGVAGMIGYAVPVSEDDPLKKITVAQFLTEEKQAGIARLFFRGYSDFNRPIGAPKIIEWMLFTGVIKWFLLLAFGLLLFVFAHRLWSLPVCLMLFMLLTLGLDTWYVSQQGRILLDPAADPADRKCAAVLLDSNLFCDTKAGRLFKRFVEDPEQPDELKQTLYGLTARRIMNSKNDWPYIRQRMAYPTVERAKELLDWANASPHRLHIPEQTCLLVIRGFTKHHRDHSRYLPPVPGKASKTGLFIFGSSIYDDVFVKRLPDGLQYGRLSWDGRYIHMTFKVRPAYAEKLEIDSSQSLTALLTFSEIIGPVLHKKSETVADNISTQDEQSVSTENEQMDFLLNFFVERARSGPPKMEVN